MVRGFIARRRYLAILEALSSQSREVLEKQASLPLEAPASSPAPLPSALVVQINGTEVEISFSPDSESLPTSGYCDCLVTATDVISRRSASVVLPSASVSRYWNLFKRLPLVFDEALVQIYRLSVVDLDQVELIGRNDPYLSLSYGDAWKVRTATVSEGGSEVEWKIPPDQSDSYQFTVTSSDLLERQRPLEVQVYDENSFRADVLIGETEVDLSPLCSLTAYGEQLSLTREIKKKGKVRGGVTVTCGLQEKVGLVGGRVEGTAGAEAVAKSRIHSLSELLLHEPLKRDFTVYLAANHLDLFLSRANGVMVLRAVK
jgi:hypothetical protein